MTLLNTPMPPDKALKIIRSIFESNRMINISISCPKAFGIDTWIEYDNFIAWAKVTSVSSIHDMVYIWDSYFAIHEDDKVTYRSPAGLYAISEITIIWINQIIPTYSIGDKVLILSTGEIGTLDNMWYKQETGKVIHTGRYMITLPNGKEIPNVHWSEIAKLPNDL